MSIRARPMQLLCKIIGVAPYSFAPSSSETIFKPSKFGVIYSLIISALLTWFAILNYQTTEANLISGSYVTIGAQWLQFYVNNGFSVLIVIAHSLQQWKIVKVFNALFCTKRHPQTLPVNGERIKDIFYGIGIAVVTIFFHLLTTLTSYYDNEKRIDYYWFPYGILFLLNTLVVLQFLCGVVKVGTKFKALNNRLEDCIAERHTFKLQYNNAETIDVVLDNTAGEHQDIIDSTNLLISAFSYQLLLCFVAALIISVSGLYMICKRIIQRSIESDSLVSHQLQKEKDYNWWALSCYPLLHSILVGSVITVCHLAVNQSRLLNGILPRIHRVFKLPPAGSSAIDSFSYQLLLQPVSFDVFNFFTMQPSIICSIISTVLTYLIILVQFEIGQDSANIVQMDSFNSEAAFMNFRYSSATPYNYSMMFNDSDKNY